MGELDVRLLIGLLPVQEDAQDLCRYGFYMRLGERVMSEPGLLSDPEMQRIVARLVRDKAVSIRDGLRETMVELLRELHLYEIEAPEAAVVDDRDRIKRLHLQLRGMLVQSPGLIEESRLLLEEARGLLERRYHMRSERRYEVDRLEIEELLDVRVVDRLIGFVATM